MLSVKELASKLSIAQSTVYALISQGQLKCHRIGVGRGTIRIAEADVLDYLARNSSATTSIRKSLSTSTLRHITLEQPASLAPEDIEDCD